MNTTVQHVVKNSPEVRALILRAAKVLADKHRATLVRLADK